MYSMSEAPVSSCKAADYRNELRLARLRGLIEDTCQAGNANRFNGQNPNANGKWSLRSEFHGPPFGSSKGLSWIGMQIFRENCWLVEFFHLSNSYALVKKRHVPALRC